MGFKSPVAKHWLHLEDHRHLVKWRTFYSAPIGWRNGFTVSLAQTGRMTFSSEWQGFWMCSICGNGRQLRARMLVFDEQQKNVRAEELRGLSKLLYRWIIGVVSLLLARARLLCLLIVRSPPSCWSWVGWRVSFPIILRVWMNECLTLPNGVSPPCRGWLGSASAMEQSALWRKAKEISSTLRPVKRRAFGRLASILEMQHFTYDLTSSKSL